MEKNEVNKETDEANYESVLYLTLSDAKLLRQYKILLINVLRHDQRVIPWGLNLIVELITLSLK
ncbi:hypothetical protein [Paenibacillus macquariensis]|uniref:hypothetical protein n=1 Tax=Paenibacillus macquariensis TaxID=948756 RepID=UPI00111578F2|nr:hypothetical protein [Paenibacillus macquariensis]MEC0089923.1 hypothetical protein [Paenibacillus macquariensis]